MHRLRMTEADNLRELLQALRRLAEPLARRGAILFMQVDDVHAPSYLDVRLDGFGQESEAQRYMCRLIIRFLRGKWRYRYMRQLICEGHSYLTIDEVDFLAASAYGRLVRQEAAKADPHGEAFAMEHILAGVMAEHDDVHLDGLLRFRFTSWLKGLREVVQERVDEYLVSREYEEFIGILRYFLETTPVSPETLHVICVGDSVIGLDKELHLLDLTTVEMIARESEEDELHPQDVLMSALITRAPEKLVIHALSAEESFVKTLLRVFGSRATLCGDDPDCTIFTARIDNVCSTFYTTL